MDVYTDGGARGNPGPAAIGVVLVENGQVLNGWGERIGRATNNQAEYRALIRGLEMAKMKGARNANCFSDSQLVVRQVNGMYKIRNSELQKLFDKLRNMESGFGKVSYSHVRRENMFIQRADGLVNRALDNK